jgi:hypothetical protein
VISTPSSARIWVVAGSTDLRKGFDGLCAMVQHQLNESPFTGDLYIFRGRGGDKIKILWYCGDGLALFYKRLSHGVHCRRAFFDLYEANKSPTAREAIDRIRKLYEIEDQIRGQPAQLRLVARKQYAVPLLDALHRWMLEMRTKVENKSELAKAFDYALNRWCQLSRYIENGTLEIDNDIAERSVRGVAVGRKNFLFFGSNSGGERAAIAYSLIECCKLNKIDPQRYLDYVLTRIADHPINRVDELLPWNVADKLGQPEQVTKALAASA